MVQICLIKVQRLNKYEMGIKIGHVIVLEKLAPRTRWHELCKTQIPAQTRVPEFKLTHLWPSPLYILPRPSPSTLYLLPFLLPSINPNPLPPTGSKRQQWKLFLKVNIKAIKNHSVILIWKLYLTEENNFV